MSDGLLLSRNWSTARRGGCGHATRSLGHESKLGHEVLESSCPFPPLRILHFVIIRDAPLPTYQSLLSHANSRMFGCGTGIVVVSIKEIRYEEQDHKLPYSPIVLSIRDTLTSLHRGKKEWKDWVYTVPEWSGVEKQNEVEGEDAYAYI